MLKSITNEIVNVVLSSVIEGDNDGINGGNLLLEDSYNLLLEDESFILLQNTN